ncbi:hypothetical protein ONZ45_g3141 [Pleurotus djamor]|nr:hypothetical protein ONZ45_g3141 [Pleurotus djamor]
MGLQLRSDATTSVEEVWTSIGAVKRALQVSSIKRPYLILSDSAKEELGTNSFQDVHCSYDAVVVGLAPSLFDYQHLNSAFRVLVGETHNDSGIKTDATAPRVAVPLIVTHKAKYRESSDPPGLSLGPGPFVDALEFAAGVKAQILGKPTEQFFSTVIEDLRREAPDLSNDRIAIIGDDVEADLGDGAVKLVRTGKYRPGDECREGVASPDETCDSLAAFVDGIVG